MKFQTSKMDMNYFSPVVSWMFLFIFMIWNTQNVNGVTNTRTINVIVSRSDSVYSFGELMEVTGALTNVITDPSHENQSIWDIGENNAGKDYKSSTDSSSLNVIETRVVIVNHYGEETLTLNNCSLETTPKTCQQASTTLYFKYIKGMGDLILVPSETSLENARVGSIVFKHYYSTPSVGNIIITGEGNLDAKVSEGCRSGTLTPETASSPLTIDSCATVCRDNSYSIFAVGSSECSCSNNTADIGADANGCTTICPGNSEQTCGSSTSSNVFLVDEYSTFNTQLQNSVQGSEIKGVINITSNSTTEQLCFPLSTTILAFTIVEEEECHLTNLYFNTTSPGYYIYYGSNPLNIDKKLRNDNYDYEFYPNGLDRIHVGSVNTDCIWVTPISHNYTFHRATITIYGKSPSEYVAAKYMALQLIILDEESSSILPSSTIMDVSSSPFDSFITVTAVSSLCSSDFSSEIVSSPVEEISSSVMESSSLEEITSSPVQESSYVTSSEATSSEAMSSEAISSAEATTVESSPVPESTSVSDISPSSPVSSQDFGPTTSHAEPSTTLYPTPAQTTTQEATMNPSEPVTSSACSCLCRKNDGQNKTDEDIAQERVLEIQEKLKVNTKKLSATIRKKISAEDNRPSAQGVGFVGIFFLTVVFSSLVLLDLTSICQHISMMKENLGKRKP